VTLIHSVITSILRDESAISPDLELRGKDNGQDKRRA
jgi:hypothetical protein